jgi:hypothetical protein
MMERACSRVRDLNDDGDAGLGGTVAYRWHLMCFREDKESHMLSPSIIKLLKRGSPSGECPVGGGQ